MNQSSYFFKVMRSLIEGTFWSKLKGFVIAKIINPFDGVYGYIKLSKADRNLDTKDGFADQRLKKNHHKSNPEHIKRIIDSYKLSKQEQPNAALPFQINGLWRNWVNNNFKKLITALDTENISDLSDLFENFYREQFTVGMGGYEFYLRTRSLLGSMYTKNIWTIYRDKLLTLDYDIQKLSSPFHGNPTGITINGNVIPIDTLRHAYHAVEMNNLLRDVQEACIVEIGGGLGGQAYQTLYMNEENVSKYLIFDIPEVVAISSYFLLSAFPEKNIRLFGEGTVSVASSEKYDIGIFPHFTIDQLPDKSVDLFYNSCSFSEMDKVTSWEYLSIIERVCKKYFMHDNHNTVLEFSNTDGSTSVNIIGSKLIPDSKLYKRIFKKPRVHGLPEDKSYEHFEYLYKRM